MRILRNGHFQTLNPKQPIVTAIAIEGDRIVAAGSDTDIMAMAGRRDLEQDLDGDTVWPGLTDAHIHLEHYALSLQYVDCETETRDECLKRVAQKAANTPRGQWIRGHGWNQNNWPEGFGSAADLDAIAPDQPVYLTAKSLHASWANSAAMRLAGITAETPDPEGGKIVKDTSGKPTGILLESAVGLVEDIIPAPTVAQVAGYLLQAQSALWQVGITGAHDYDQERCFAALQTLDREERLRLRVVKGIPFELLPHAAALGLQSGFGSRYLRIGSVKLFADGALGPQTAAMLRPYEDDPKNTGFLLLDSEQVFEAGQKAAQSGLSLAIHAIGDRANHEVLNGYAQLRQYEDEHHLPHLRHRIEHVQILHPDDYRRLAQLNVIASVQPIHATSDMFMADRFWGKRSAGAYAYGTLRNTGTALAFGSDAPVEQPNPFLGLHAAVTRTRPNGQPGSNGWYPEERLSLMDALHGFTTGAAYASLQEKQVGQIAPGFFADLIVLSRDPFQVPAGELYQIRPQATMVGGEWVWQKG
jgi:predicted amidohydrolase YtcJ